MWVLQRESFLSDSCFKDAKRNAKIRLHFAPCGKSGRVFQERTLWQSSSSEGLQVVWVLFSLGVAAAPAPGSHKHGNLGCLSMQVAAVGVCCLCAMCCTVMWVLEPSLFLISCTFTQLLPVWILCVNPKTSNHHSSCQWIFVCSQQRPSEEFPC